MNLRPPPVRKIGLTGGIGSGKSTLRRHLTEMGYCTADADTYVHRAVKMDHVRTDICELLGNQAYATDGTYDRAFVRGKVFSDLATKSGLEKILFPEVQYQFQASYLTLEQDFPGAWFFYEASLLIEAGRSREFDALILVTAPEDQKLQRVMKRSSLTELEAAKIIQNQSTDEYRRPHCLFEIANDGTSEQFRDRVYDLVKKLHSHFCPTTP